MTKEYKTVPYTLQEMRGESSQACNKQRNDFLGVYTWPYGNSEHHYKGKKKKLESFCYHPVNW